MTRAGELLDGDEFSNGITVYGPLEPASPDATDTALAAGNGHSFLDDGHALFRFCSCYWFDFSETWGLE